MLVSTVTFVILSLVSVVTQYKLLSEYAEIGFVCYERNGYK